MFIFFETNLWLNDLDSKFALLNYFFGVVKLTSDGSEFVKNEIMFELIIGPLCMLVTEKTYINYC